MIRRRLKRTVGQDEGLRPDMEGDPVTYLQRKREANQASSTPSDSGSNDKDITKKDTEKGSLPDKFDPEVFLGKKEQEKVKENEGLLPFGLPIIEISEELKQMILNLLFAGVSVIVIYKLLTLKSNKKRI